MSLNPEQVMAALQRLAHLQNDSDDTELHEAIEDAVAVITDRPQVPSGWENVLHAEAAYQVTQMGDPPSSDEERTYQQDAEWDLAWALWRVANDDSVPCYTCLDVHIGEPWQVAAKTHAASYIGQQCAQHAVTRPPAPEPDPAEVERLAALTGLDREGSTLARTVAERLWRHGVRAPGDPS